MQVHVAILGWIEGARREVGLNLPTPLLNGANDSWEE